MKVTKVKVTKVKVIGQGQTCKLPIFNILFKVKVAWSKVARSQVLMVKVVGQGHRAPSAPSSGARYGTRAFSLALRSTLTLARLGL